MCFPLYISKRWYLWSYQRQILTTHNNPFHMSHYLINLREHITVQRLFSRGWRNFSECFWYDHEVLLSLILGFWVYWTFTASLFQNISLSGDKIKFVLRTDKKQVACLFHILFQGRGSFYWVDEFTGQCCFVTIVISQCSSPSHPQENLFVCLITLWISVFKGMNILVFAIHSKNSNDRSSIVFFIYTCLWVCACTHL